jgi:hypothetical protein
VRIEAADKSRIILVCSSFAEQGKWMAALLQVSLARNLQQRHLKRCEELEKSLPSMIHSIMYEHVFFPFYL